MTTWDVDVVGGDLTDLEFIARGGSAAVYRATQRTLGRSVAVKIFDGAALDPHRAAAEARAQAAMSWHGNVITLYGVRSMPDGVPALVMEYAPGGSLRDRISSNGPSAPAEWMRIGGQVASALVAAHAAGVVHRDVKPSNVLFAADGSARLADFGIAGTLTATLDGVEGSVAYAPPELLDGDRPTAANDVYSLVVTLLVAATGREPFGADELPPAAVMARIQSERLRFSAQVSGLAPALAAALDAGLDPDPRRRPSAAELAAALAPELEPVTTRSDPVRRSAGRRRLPVIGGVALLVALMGTVLVVGNRSASEAAAPDLCGEYRVFVRSRERLFADVSTALEGSASPVAVVDQLLVDYPRDWSRLVQPYLRTVGRVSGTGPAITDSQLRLLASASVLRSLGGGKQYLFDGESGEFDPLAVPGELREPSRVFSDATSLGAERCPGVVGDLTAGKARMHSAIYANLAAPEFMDGFFADPRSLDVLDESIILLMVRMARPFFEGLLSNHWDWFIGFLQAKPDVRSALSLEYPDMVLTAGAARPDLMDPLVDAAWRSDLNAGLARLGPAARAGIVDRFRPDINRWGLDAG